MQFRNGYSVRERHTFRSSCFCTIWILTLFKGEHMYISDPWWRSQYQPNAMVAGIRTAAHKLSCDSWADISAKPRILRRYTKGLSLISVSLHNNSMKSVLQVFKCRLQAWFIGRFTDEEEWDLVRLSTSMWRNTSLNTDLSTSRNKSVDHYSVLCCLLPSLHPLPHYTHTHTHTHTHITIISLPPQSDAWVCWQVTREWLKHLRHAFMGGETAAPSDFHLWRVTRVWWRCPTKALSFKRLVSSLPCCSSEENPGVEVLSQCGPFSDFSLRLAASQTRAVSHLLWPSISSLVKWEVSYRVITKSFLWLHDSSFLNLSLCPKEQLTAEHPGTFSPLQ